MDLRHSEDYYIRTLLNKVKLKEIMAKKVIAIDVKEPFSRVEEKFREFGIRHLPVVREKKILVGIITQRDLYRIQSPRKKIDDKWYYDKQILDSYTLGKVMTPDPLTLKPDNTVADALLMMVDRKYGCIPIVEKKRSLCGLVTQIDILRIGAQILREK